MTPETIKEQITEKYLEEFKKELWFLQKMILFPLENDIKKILRWEKNIPEHFSDLNQETNKGGKEPDWYREKIKNFALTSWRSLTSFIFSKEEKNLLTSLKDKQEKVQQETKEKLKTLEQEVHDWGKKVEWTEKLETLTEQENFIYSWAKKIWMTDKRQIAYVLATVKWESDFRNIKEIWWENRKYGKPDPETGKRYYGRWYIQLTLKNNYKAYNKIIQASWMQFKDNNWKIMEKIDIVKNPDLILQSNDLAAFILVHWMHKWSPVGRKLSNYINNQKCDFYNARILINNDVAKNWKRFQQYAQEYLKKISK